MTEHPLHDRHTPITFSREQMTEIRHAMHAGTDLPPCPNCGEHLSMGVPAAAGGTVGPVWQVLCDGCGRAAFLTEMAGARAVPDDRAMARGLPDEYVGLDMLPTYGVQHLVARHWPVHAEVERRALVAKLRPILEPLAEPGSVPSDDDRQRCEDAVIAWIAEI